MIMMQVSCKYLRYPHNGFFEKKTSSEMEGIVIQESGENYLETILLLSKKNGVVRSVDIANELDYTKPSISRAMGILKNANYITIGADGHIELTQNGHEKAGEILARHQMITKFLETVLELDHNTANKDACRIEHVISQTTVDKIKDYLEGGMSHGTRWMGNT